MIKLVKNLSLNMAREHRETGGRDQHRSRRRRYPSDFTYINSWVKYSMFMFNFLFWLMGVLLLGIGTYAVIDKWASGEGFRMENVYDIIFNLAFLLIICGGVISIVSFAGCIGALRENMCLLKFYSFCLLMFFLLEMALAALGFIFPYKVSGFLEGTLSDELIQNYRDDLDFQNLIDLVQKDFECCGISNEGYRDWSKNPYFNCTEKREDNPSVERCGVPFSCCLQNVQTELNNDGLVNIMCGFGVQELKHQKDVVKKVHTKGCIHKLQQYFEKNLFTVGIVALCVAVTQLGVIWLSRTLEGQIENQRSLWKYNH